MTIYDQKDREYARDTWAGFNKGFLILAALLFFLAIMSFLWNGADTGILLLKAVATVVGIGLLSIVVYCVAYSRDINW